MNILYLHTDPIIRREHLYYSIANFLEERYGHNVIFSYVGPQIINFKGSIPAYNFDEWARKNKKLIINSSILDLEREFFLSNLWLGIVSERRIANYSLLENTFGFRKYKIDDLLYLLKSIVLYYKELIHQNEITFILAQHPDNIHSVIAFEMAESLNIKCAMLNRDQYWAPDSFFFFDDKYYRSSKLSKLHNYYFDRYDELIRPIENQIAMEIEKKISFDPGEKRKDILPRIGLLENFTNSITSLIRNKKFFSLGEKNILDGFWQRDYLASLIAFTERSKNLISMKLSSCFDADLPGQPYVYFPLHLQPEAALLASAPVYINQLALIQAISASLPAGFSLVVKDHPKIGGTRPIRFYREIHSLPNIVLLKTTFPSSVIIKSANLIITIRGTIGYQALLYNKPIIVFGNVYYDCVHGVTKVDNLNELPYLLKKRLFSMDQLENEDNRKSLFSFIKAYKDIKIDRIKKMPKESLMEKASSYSQLINKLIELEYKGLSDYS